MKKSLFFTFPSNFRYAYLYRQMFVRQQQIVTIAMIFFSDLNFVFVPALRDNELLKIIFLYKWEIWLYCIFGLLKYINWFVTGYLPCGDEYNFWSWRNNLFYGFRLRIIALTENINLIWIFQWILIIVPSPTTFLRLSVKVYKRFAIK